jgi:hypothetical protein
MSIMSNTAEAHSMAGAPKVKDALDHARAAAQELHGALSDAAAKRGGAIKGDLESIPIEARAIAESIGSSLGAQNAAAKHSLAEAATYLQATAAHATEALKSSGRAAETSIWNAITDARASVQKISEAVAAKRSPAPTLQLKK